MRIKMNPLTKRLNNISADMPAFKAGFVLSPKRRLMLVKACVILYSGSDENEFIRNGKYYKISA